MRLPRFTRASFASVLSLVAAGTVLTVLTGAPPADAAGCTSTRGAFTPARAVISGIGTKTMVPVGTTNGALATPPKTTMAGLQQVGWYRYGYLPGSGYSVALDAHSWFRSAPTLSARDRNLALGNALLLSFRKGSTITLSNANGSKHICYRVVSRTVYSPSSPTPMRQAVLTHRDQVGIIVCSGRRAPNGVYSQRTVWIAVRA